MQKNSFEYNFLGGVQYAYQGTMQSACSITVYAPNGLVQIENSVIDKEVKLAMYELSKNRNDETQEVSKDTDLENIEPSQFVDMIFMGNASCEKMYIALKSILTKGYKTGSFGMLDGVQKLTSLIYDDISCLDIKNILGLYIKNFIISSQAK